MAKKKKLSKSKSSKKTLTSPESVVISKQQLEELNTKATSFAFCLSAMIMLFGEKIDDHTFEHILRLADFQAASDSSMNIDNGLYGEEAGTKVTVKLPGHNGIN